MHVKECLSYWTTLVCVTGSISILQRCTGKKSPLGDVKGTPTFRGSPWNPVRRTAQLPHKPVVRYLNYLEKGASHSSSDADSFCV